MLIQQSTRPEKTRLRLALPQAVATWRRAGKLARVSKGRMPLDDGPELFYALSVCFAVGIWLVFARYQSVKNRAVPFKWPAPDVNFPYYLVNMDKLSCVFNLQGY